GGRGGEGGVIGAGRRVEVGVDEVGAAELLVPGAALIHLAGIYLDLVGGVLEAADAGARQLRRETQAQCVPGRRAGDVQAPLAATFARRVGLAAQLDGVEPELEIEGAGLSRGQRETLEIHD